MKVAVMWSGGKDSNLAYYKGLKCGYEIAGIVTFTFDKMLFKAHPGQLLPLQAEALGTKYFKFNANKPYIGDYRRAIKYMIKEEGIDGLVTGDISLEDSRKWMKKLCKPLPIKVIMPLWNLPSARILNEVVAKNFKPIITCVKRPLLGEEWLGKTINNRTLGKLKKHCKKNGADACGENGEFHTMILDAPTFKGKIKIEKFSIGKKKEYSFLKPEKFYLDGEKRHD